jgi:hypothetical protein
MRRDIGEGEAAKERIEKEHGHRQKSYRGGGVFIEPRHGAPPGVGRLARCIPGVRQRGLNTHRLLPNRSRAP